jgi:hypothetical protein
MKLGSLFLDEVLEIKDTFYIQKSNITLREKARLIIEDSLKFPILPHCNSPYKPRMNCRSTSETRNAWME